MFEILKNMFRRKTRTTLTIFGITIGIFAFVVMGSMAEKINLLVSGGTKYYADKVTISGGESTFIAEPLSINKAQEIAKVKGVAYVSPSIYTNITDLDAINFGPPPAISSYDAMADNYESFKLNFREGRNINKGENNVIVVGSDLVKKLNAKLDQNVTIKEKKYKVVGILEKTLTAPDTTAVVSLADAQKIYFDSLPELIKSQIKPSEIVNGFTVYPEKNVDPDELAIKINKEVTGMKASGPKVFQEQIANATAIFNAILFGIALISLLVGGLSIINTMTMSISERMREIGIKKAVGAKTHNIMGEYLTEAGLIGLIGGTAGWLLGAILIFIVNRSMEDSGTVIFLLTARISIFAILFSVVLGVIAGIYPAYYAVKVNIVRALREE